MKRRHAMRRSAERLQRIVDEFNSKFPVGSTVILRKDTGEVETEVLARACVLSGHSAVGWFAGISGCYDIEGRVRETSEQKG